MLISAVKRYFDFCDAALEWADPARGAFNATLLATLTPSLKVGHPLDGRFEFDDRIVCTAMVALA